MRRKGLKLKSIRIYELYYPLMALVYIMTIVSTRVFRPGNFSAALIIIIWACMLYELCRRKFAKNAKITDISDAISSLQKSDSPQAHSMQPRSVLDSIFSCPTEDIVMSLWIIYNIISGIWTTLFGMPLSVYLGELFTTALPMVFYFAGRSGERRDEFYTGFIASVIAIGAVGFIFYVTAPRFFIDYLYNMSYISKADVATSRVRMYSVVGSTLMGYLSAAAMLPSARVIMKTRGRSGKLIFFVCASLAFMSNQRAAMVAAILVLLYMNYLVFFVFDMIPRKYLRLECAALLFVFAALLLIGRGAAAKVYYRLISLPGAISQRSDQWVGAANNMVNYWLGNGLGANGHRSAPYTKHMIADGGIAKLYCEMGIIGTSLFIFLLLLCFKKGRLHLERCACELGLVAVTLLIAIGSNVMSFALAVPILYFSIGVIVSEIYADEGAKKI